VSTQSKIIQPSRVIFPLGMGTALSLIGDATLYTVLPTHTAEAGITLAAVGIILSANRVIRLFLNGPIGLAYDRSLRRRLFIPALFIGALSTAIYAATSGFWPLLAGRLLWGLAWSEIWVGGSTIILDVTSDENRGRWTGVYQTWFFLGIALGAFLGGLLTDWQGYHTAMWIGASLTAIGGFIALFTLPETRYARQNPHDKSVATGLPKWHNNPGLRIAASIYGINRFVIAGVIAATIALLVQEQFSSEDLLIGLATLTGLITVSRTLISVVAAPISGSLSDRLGSRWKVTLGGLVIGAIGMMLLSRGNYLTILLGIIMSAIAGGSLQALTTAIAGDSVNLAHRGRAIGLLHTSGDLGSALAPPIAYALLPWIGLSGVYILSAGMFAIGSMLVLGIALREQVR
jgi:MFS family permease